MGFGEEEAFMTDAHELVFAPVRLLGLAVATAAASVLALAIEGQAAHLVGWLSGSILTILAVSLFRVRDVRASTSPWYSPQRYPDLLAIAVLVIGLVSAGFHAYYFATVQAS